MKARCNEALFCEINETFINITIFYRTRMLMDSIQGPVSSIDYDVSETGYVSSIEISSFYWTQL
jgi:hypothetical protein